MSDITIRSKKRLEVIDITDRVNDFIVKSKTGGWNRIGFCKTYDNCLDCK